MNYVDEIITEALIVRAQALDACDEGIEEARGLLGRPLSALSASYRDWAACLFDGGHVLSDGSKAWYKGGKLHREGDLPAVERADGSKYWYVDDKLHREGGLPAVEYANGTKFWYVDGKLHREGGLPAVEYANGHKGWWVNDKRHREGNLPAVEYADGRKEWWVDGCQAAQPGDVAVL